MYTSSEYSPSLNDQIVHIYNKPFDWDLVHFFFFFFLFPRYVSFFFPFKFIYFSTVHFFFSTSTLCFFPFLQFSFISLILWQTSLLPVDAFIYLLSVQSNKSLICSSSLRPALLIDWRDSSSFFFPARICLSVASAVRECHACAQFLLYLSPCLFHLDRLPAAQRILDRPLHARRTAFLFEHLRIIGDRNFRLTNNHMST
ncbi:unnamed protein product [Acanthosepion pharaonis]|uniref:Uncharacterized protein n=1 Tax=Acanthosepion pharaonis TaxID=158019 RepID=A0A812BK52_ACAPH|nr:unnamed protein product [Sepia pharaonis]